MSQLVKQRSNHGDMCVLMHRACINTSATGTLAGLDGGSHRFDSGVGMPVEMEVEV